MPEAARTQLTRDGFYAWIEPDHPQVRLDRRDAGRSRVSERSTGLEVALPIVQIDLKLSDIYVSLEFRRRRSLVSSDRPASRFAI